MPVATLTLPHVSQPPLTTKYKRPHHVIHHAPPYKSMEELAAEVKKLFEKPLADKRLFDLSSQLQVQYRESLQCSTISMLPSFQHTLPTGQEQGDFLALDVGGSTFRVALIRLCGKKDDSDGLQVRRVRSYAIDEAIRDLPGQAFFDWMAQRIGDMATEYSYITGTTNAFLRMGLAWSFPVEQTSSSTGKLLAMGKGFRASQGLEGEDVGELVMRGCRARGLNVAICAIVNDSAATLLSQAYRDPATRMSLILGTGVNAAVYLPLSALGPGKLGERPDKWHAAAKSVVVNTELSMFGKEIMPTTRWDEELNLRHKMPNYQPLEYLITGRYLGEIVRLVLLEAITTRGLFAGYVPEHLDEAYAFDTRIVGAFESDRSEGLESAQAAFMAAHPMLSPPTLAELNFIRDVAKLVSRRASAYLATALHAFWVVSSWNSDHQAGKFERTTIACDGSLMEKYPGFRKATQRCLDRLCALSGAETGTVTLQMAPESSIFGAAVAVSCNG